MTGGQGRQDRQQRQTKDTRTARGQERIRQQREEREERKRQQHRAEADARARSRGDRGGPAFVPTVGDDLLLGLTIAALVAGTGVSTLAVWAGSGWGGAIGWFAVFGVLGIGAIVAILQNSGEQRKALWWLTATGVGFALFAGLWMAS